MSAPERRRRSPRQLAMLLIGIALSGACLYLAMRNVDFSAIGRVLGAANLVLAVPLVALQVVFYFVKAVRWRLLLTPVRVTSARRLLAPMMIGFAANNLLPARLGELIRVHLGARLLLLSHSEIAATVLLERLFDFIAVLSLFGAGMFLLPDVPAALVSAGYGAAALSLLLMASIAAFLVWTTSALALMRLLTVALPERLGRIAQEQLTLIADGMAALRRPDLLAGIAATSVLQWFLMSGCIFVSFRAVGVDVPAPATFIVLAATVFGVMVPAAPGFFGTLHLAFVLALGPFAVDDNKAMAAAVFYHIIPYVSVIAAGGWFARQTGLRLLEVERAAQTAQLDAEEATA